MARRRHRSRKSARKSRKSRKSLFGGKRSIGPALKNWIAHIKQVQKQHGISYKEAMILAGKQRKAKH